MWNKSNLKNLIKCLEYRRALYTKLSKQTQKQDVEQEWEQIRMAITEAASEVIQKQDKKQRNEWWGMDCQLAIYSIKPERVANGTTRKEMKQKECAH